MLFLIIIKQNRMNKLNIDRSMFVENRKRLSEKLKPNSIIVLNSNDVMPTNADGTVKFKQNNDLFYFTGIEQEETVLLMYPDCTDQSQRTILFIRDVNPDLELWEGSKLNEAEAENLSGIDSVLPVSKFDRIFRSLMSDAGNLYLNTNEHKRSSVEVETRDDRFIKKCKIDFPLHNFYRAAPVIYRLRAVKSDYEINLLQEACNLTGKGFRRALKFIKPGVMEFEIEAEFAHEFIRSGSSYADYRPIIASGINACSLHYEKNNKKCETGELVLMDVGAMYANYNADMTRTVPVSGKFTKRQKNVYNSVLKVLRETRKLMVKGKMLDVLLGETEDLMEKELVSHKLIKSKQLKDKNEKHSAMKKYYPHGVSHFLGLDVHDVGYFNEPLRAGMVLTCEPGIYIREEGFGIRLENNIVIQKKGNLDLMENIPIEADEIEELMNSK